MEDLLRGAVKKDCPWGNEHKLELCDYCGQQFESLRESGLLRLLLAGQALRDLMKGMEFSATFQQEDEYNAALAEMKEKLN